MTSGGVGLLSHVLWVGLERRCSVGAVNWNIPHYKQKTPVFLCSFNKPQPSPLGHKRNQCSLQEQQQKWSLVLQIQRWWWFFTRISENSKVLRFQIAKWKLCREPFFVLSIGIKNYIYSHCWALYLSNAKPSCFWKLSLLLERPNFDAEFWHLLVLVPWQVAPQGHILLTQPGSSQEAAASQGRLGKSY